MEVNRIDPGDVHRLADLGEVVGRAWLAPPMTSTPTPTCDYSSPTAVEATFPPGTLAIDVMAQLLSRNDHPRPA